MNGVGKMKISGWRFRLYGCTDELLLAAAFHSGSFEYNIHNHNK